MKLWDKGYETNKIVERFTVGKDRELDIYLVRFDVLGTIAHIIMLESIGLLTLDELQLLKKELVKIYFLANENKFSIEEGLEDVHSQVELMLTRQLGETGKKVHSGRSRNDQVLLDLKLYMRDELHKIVILVNQLFERLILLSETHKDILIPGYTHFQVAMPSSFGLWFGAYAESLTDDLLLAQAAWKINNQNPLGSAAGYGSSFPLNRQLTTDLLGFDRLNYNVVYAQMGRGKVEKTVGFALSSIASTLSRMAMDICLFNGQNFAFLSFPKELTTGSSIMPHKKNPDVFELIRAKGNKIQAVPNQIELILSNLPSGYHRDLQIIKEIIIPAIEDLKDSLEICDLMLSHIQINKDIIFDDKYKYVFSVEEVNKLVLDGIPFRDAYKIVGTQVEDGSFNPEKKVLHTHEGSIGNLCNKQISEKMNEIISDFCFERVEKAINQLIK